MATVSKEDNSKPLCVQQDKGKSRRGKYWEVPTLGIGDTSMANLLAKDTVIAIITIMNIYCLSVDSVSLNSGL